ncbi:hypothetical protein ACET3Z_000317 [Daucus carota]
MTSVAYQYSGPKSKVFKRIDVDKLSVKDIREMVRDVVSDDDKLYMMRDGVTPDEGFKLLVKDKHVLELVNASEMTGVCKIHVYHAYSQAPLPPVLEDSEDEEEAVKESEADNMIGDVGNNEKNQDDEEISIIEKKRSRKKKTTEEEDEVERREMEIETGEAELMEEALRNEGQPPTSPITPRRSQRLSQGTVDTQSTMDDTQPPTSVFMPTPGFNISKRTGGTPIADKPRTSRKIKTVKGFTAPRRKK